MIQQMLFGMPEDLEEDDGQSLLHETNCPNVEVGLSHAEVEIILDSMRVYKQVEVKKKHLRWASNDNKNMKGVEQKIRIAQNKIIEIKLKSICSNLIAHFYCPDCDEEKIIEHRHDETLVVYCTYCGERIFQRKDKE